MVGKFKKFLISLGLIGSLLGSPNTSEALEGKTRDNFYLVLKHSADIKVHNFGKYRTEENALVGLVIKTREMIYPLRLDIKRYIANREFRKAHETLSQIYNVLSGIAAGLKNSELLGDALDELRSLRAQVVDAENKLKKK